MENRPENLKKSLFVFAHRPEAKAFIAACGFKPNLRPNLLKSEPTGDWLLISGEGIASALAETSFALGLLNGQIRRVLNFGVAGSLSSKLSLNEIVEVRTVYGRKQSQASEFKSFTTASQQAKFDCVSSERRVVDAASKNQLLPIADIVDREAWGIGWSAKSCSLPFYLIKIMSDFADDDQSCELIASSADRYSSALYQYYLDRFAPRPTQHSPDSQKRVDADLGPSRIDLGLSFHVTTTQSRQIKTILERLALKSGIAVEPLLESYLASEPISKISLASSSPKSKTKHFIDYLKSELNPHLAATKRSIASLLQSIQTENCKISCDPSLEEPGFRVEAKVKSASDLESVQQKLTALPFAEMEALLSGEASNLV